MESDKEPQPELGKASPVKIGIRRDMSVIILLSRQIHILPQTDSDSFLGHFERSSRTQDGACLRCLCGLFHHCRHHFWDFGGL